MSIARRKSAVMSTILGMEYSDALEEDKGIGIDANEELEQDDLTEVDLSFLDDEETTEDDVEFDVEDIVGCADNHGKVKMSSIRALAECNLPDDRDEDEIVAREDEEITANEDDMDELEASLEDDIDDVLEDEEPAGEVEASDKKEVIEDVVARIDRLANYCECSGNRKLAYRLDVIADKLENI